MSLNQLDSVKNTFLMNKKGKEKETTLRKLCGITRIP